MSLKSDLEMKFEKEYNPRAVNAAIRYSKKYGYECKNNSTYNNEADAFKHTFASALVSLEEGYLISLGGGIYHEMTNSHNNENEYKMDINNNGIGRQIARNIKNDYGDKWKTFTSQTKDDIIAERVWQRMIKGDIILDPTGRRILKNMPIKIKKSTKNENKSQKGCVGSYPVSGYTRSDGVEVKGYTRTCGAKHISNGDKNNNRSGFAPEHKEIKRDDGGCWGGSDVVMYLKDRQKVLNKYKGKKAQDLSKSEIEEFLKAYL